MPNNKKPNKLVFTKAMAESLTAEDIRKLSLPSQYRVRWLQIARDKQIPPTDDSWSYFLALAGRGFGKTRLGAEAVAFYGQDNPGTRIAIVAPTYKDARDTCIEGDSGLLSCLPDNERNGWNRSLGELKLSNGTIYQLFTSEKPDALRGPQFHYAWCDELAQWNDLDYCWDMLQMCCRLGRHPQIIVTTTPLPLELIKRLIKDPKSYVVTGSTYENQANLADTFIEKILSKYEGTRLGEQELHAKILDDVPGALWQREWIESTRLRTGETPDQVAQRCTRIVVAIDPATTSTKESDLTGIVAAGIDEKGRGYVLSDLSCKVTPNEWASRAIALYTTLKADRIVGEVNNGGDMVESTIRVVNENVPFKKVSASKGKFVRAEPIASLYEQRRISHVGRFENLENEMCSFTPENIVKNSPNRCFVAGTLIRCLQGEVPIEDVRVGDLVWTRKGLRPVYAAGITSNLEPTLTVELSNGVQLVGTSDHPIWVEGRGFMPLHSVAAGEEVLNWQGIQSRLMGSCSTETRSLHGVATESTTPAMQQPGRCVVSRSSTGTCGVNTTAQYQRGTSSTTATAIHSTTPLLTAGSFLEESTGCRTRARVRVVRVSESAKAPVYNVSVLDTPEYFANGVLVHNCDALVWALTELYGNMLTYGAMDFLKQVQAEDVAQAQQAITRKILRHDTDSLVHCKACEATCISKIGRQFRCNRCGTQWASGTLTADYSQLFRDLRYGN